MLGRAAGSEGATSDGVCCGYCVCLNGLFNKRILGFIQPQSGGKDVFVHISRAQARRLKRLNEGATVDYEIVSDRGK